MDETEYNNAPNSRIAELLLELKEQIEEDFTELTASGAIASFETNVSKPIVNLTAYVKATQEAGTPTPQSPKAISGVSVVNIGYVDMNQKIKNGNFVNDSDWTTNGATFSVSDNIATLLATNSGGGLYQAISLTEGHLYLFKANVKTTSQTNKIRLCVNRSVSPYDLSDFYSQNSSDWQELVIIKKSSYTGSYQFRILDMRTADFDDVKLENIIYIDITQAFGEKIANYLYSLPDKGLSIIEQIFTKDYYSYNVGGTLVSVDSVNGEPTCPNAVINLGGTYYGGQVEIDKNGHRRFKVTSVKKKLSDYAWTKGNVNSANTGRIFRHNFANDTETIVRGQSLCDCFKNNSTSVWENLGLYEYTDYSNGYFVFCVEDNYATSTEMLEDYGDVEFTVILKTPYYIDLTDGEPIVAYEGSNNIWNDSSDSEVTYLYKGQPILTNMLSSNNDGGLLGMDTENNTQEE